jgi:hypothetical protein
VLKKNGLPAQADEPARIDNAAASCESFRFMTFLLGIREASAIGAARCAGRREVADRCPRAARRPPRARGIACGFSKRRSRVPTDR